MMTNPNTVEFVVMLEGSERMYRNKANKRYKENNK